MIRLLFIFLVVGFSLNAQDFIDSRDYSSLSTLMNQPTTEAGDIVEVYGEFLSGTGFVKDGVYIVGKTPDAAIIGGGVSSQTSSINISSGTINIKDVNLKGRYVIKASSGAVVNLENVNCSPSDPILSLGGFDSWNGGLIEIDSATVNAINCNVYNSSNQSSPWEIKDSFFNWQGSDLEVDAILATGNNRIDIDVNKASGIYGAGQHNRWRFGEKNPYNSSILGSISNVLDTLPTNYLHHNETQSGYVKISIKDGRYLWSGIVACGNYTMNIENSMFAGKTPDENGEMPSMTGIEFENNATVKLANVVTARIDAKWFHGYFEADANTQIYYDRDLVVDESKVYGSLYDSSNFPDVYGQGTHGVEGSDVYNLKAIPTYRFDFTQIIYMGDDVLNRLPTEQALKELSVNSAYRSNTEDYPDDTGLSLSPVYALSTSYTEGQTIFLNNSIFVVVEDFISTNAIDDHNNNKIRILVGCKKFGKYYGTLIYEQDRGWVNVFTLSQWHGGYCRNRGNAVAFYNGNVIGNIRLIEHNNTWTWFDQQKTGVKYYDKEGKNAYYRNIITTKFGDYWDLESLDITQVGITEDFAKKSALQIDLQEGIPNQTIRIQDLKIHSQGLSTPVEIVGVDLNGHSLYIGNMSVVGMPENLSLPDFGVFGGQDGLIQIRKSGITNLNFVSYVNDLLDQNSFAKRDITKTELE